MLFNLRLLPLAILPLSLLISSLVADFVLISSVIFFIGHCIKKKNFYWIKDKYFILLFIFYVYLLINFYFSQSREESFSRAFSFIRFPLFIMSVKYLFLEDFSKINSIIKFWTIIIVVVIVDTLIQYHYGKNIFGYSVLIMSDQIRLSSFLNKEYKIGGYILVFSFIICTYFVDKILKKNFYNKLLILSFYLLSLITIYLSGERSNFIIFLLCSTVFIFFSDLKIKLKILLLMFLLISILLLFKFDSKLKIRFIDQTKDIISYQKLSFKDSILQSHYGAHYVTAYQIFKDYPFIGSGIKTFRVVCKDEKYDNYNIPWIKSRCTTHPHNIILEFLSELGIIGTLLFFFFFFYLLIKKVVLFFKEKNNFLLGLIICTAFIYFPILPRGSFFTNWNAIIFWTIISLLISFKVKKENKS